MPVSTGLITKEAAAPLLGAGHLRAPTRRPPGPAPPAGRSAACPPSPACVLHCINAPCGGVSRPSQSQLHTMLLHANLHSAAPPPPHCRHCAPAQPSHPSRSRSHPNPPLPSPHKPRGTPPSRKRWTPRRPRVATPPLLALPNVRVALRHPNGGGHRTARARRHPLLHVIAPQHLPGISRVPARAMHPQPVYAAPLATRVRLNATPLGTRVRLNATPLGTRVRLNATPLGTRVEKPRWAKRGRAGSRSHAGGPSGRGVRAAKEACAHVYQRQCHLIQHLAAVALVLLDVPAGRSQRRQAGRHAAGLAASAAALLRARGSVSTGAQASCAAAAHRASRTAPSTRQAAQQAAIGKRGGVHGGGCVWWCRSQRPVGCSSLAQTTALGGCQVRLVHCSSQAVQVTT